MALDQSQLLQMLFQGGGGGGTAISPTSGLQDPSLSGLMLGPQGMDFGGGGSLMGGGATGFGGNGGGGLGGLDLSQLLAQLQAAPGVTGAGLTSGIGGDLGGGMVPTAGQRGQAGLGVANTTAQLLNLLREGVGLGRSLAQLFPKGPTPTDLQGINLPGGSEFPEAFGAIAGARFPPEFPIEATGTPAPWGGFFSQSGNILPAVPGGGFAALQPASISAPFLAGGGPESVGQVAASAPGPEAGLGGSAFTPLSAVGGGLAGAGGIFRAVTAPTTLGRAAGATESAIAAAALLSGQPELLLLEAIPGAADLFGGLFGGGPSQSWLTFPSRLAGTLGGEQEALSAFDQAVQQAQFPQDISQALATFQQAIQNAGVGGYLGAPQVGFGPPGFQWAPIPGAGGSRHEGGIVWDPSAAETQVGADISARLAQFQQAQQHREQLLAAQKAQQARLVAQPAQAPAPTPTPVNPTGGVSSLNLPGSPETDLLTLLRQMGLA